MIAIVNQQKWGKFDLSYACYQARCKKQHGLLERGLLHISKKLLLHAMRTIRQQTQHHMHCQLRRLFIRTLCMFSYVTTSVMLNDK